MRIRVLAIGQRMPGWVNDAWQEYTRRMPPSVQVELREIPLAQRGKNQPPMRAMSEEGSALLQAAGSDHVVALDGRGSPWSTELLSRQLAGWMEQGGDVSLLIGGPDGLSAETLKAARQRWSLGPLTLPHPMVRVVLAEQLYRAWTILQNHPYHRA